MHIAMVVEGVPSPSTTGSAMLNWTVADYLIRAGHKVTACIILSPPDDESQEGFEELKKALSETGVCLELLRVPITVPRLGNRNNKWATALKRLGTALRPTLTDFFPAAALSSQLAEILERDRPDVIYVYDYGPLGAMENIRVAPRLAIPGDPRHLVSRFRLRFSRQRGNFSLKAILSYIGNTLGYIGLARVWPQIARGVLPKYESVACFPAQHAAWIQEQGVPCKYLHAPVDDLAGSNWEERRRAGEGKAKPKILVLGQLQNTPSLVGLSAFAEVTLPALEQQLGPEGFEVVIGGRGAPPPDLVKKLTRPSVHMRGYIEDLASEFFSADLCLVPGAYPLGVRTRLLTAMPFGICIVTHSSTAFGIPELVHGDNCLLGDDDLQVADHVVQALKDRSLRERLGRNARMTYEEHFAPEIAGAGVLAELERIAREYRKP